MVRVGKRERDRDEKENVPAKPGLIKVRKVSECVLAEKKRVDLCKFWEGIDNSFYQIYGLTKTMTISDYMRLYT
jgi:hypothetical protein